MNISDYKTKGKAAVASLLEEAGVKVGEIRFCRGAIYLYTSDSKEVVRIYHDFDIDGSYNFSVQTCSLGPIDPTDNNSETEAMRITGALFCYRLLSKAIKELCIKLDTQVEL